jgi:hypothetical protein
MLWPSKLYTCGVWRSRTRVPFQYIVVTFVVAQNTNAMCTHASVGQVLRKPVLAVYAVWLQ